jgi:hypothetical protein
MKTPSDRFRPRYTDPVVALSQHSYVSSRLSVLPLSAHMPLLQAISVFQPRAPASQGLGQGGCSLRARF